MTEIKDSPQETPASQKSEVWAEVHDYALALYTDGSCYYKDKIGGCSAVAVSKVFDVFEITKIGSTHTTVERMELEGLLSGLQAFLEATNMKDRKSQAKLRVSPISVFWLTDRLNLCQSVNRELPRQTNGDMWARLAWYEQLFKIKGHHAARNSHSYQALADLISSDCRKLIKNYETDYDKLKSR